MVLFEQVEKVLSSFCTVYFGKSIRRINYSLCCLCCRSGASMWLVSLYYILPRSTAKEAKKNYNIFDLFSGWDAIILLMLSRYTLNYFYTCGNLMLFFFSFSADFIRCNEPKVNFEQKKIQFPKKSTLNVTFG